MLFPPTHGWEDDEAIAWGLTSVLTLADQLRRVCMVISIGLRSDNARNVTSRFFVLLEQSDVFLTRHPTEIDARTLLHRSDRSWVGEPTPCAFVPNTAPAYGDPQTHQRPLHIVGLTTLTTPVMMRCSEKITAGRREHPAAEYYFETPSLETPLTDFDLGQGLFRLRTRDDLSTAPDRESG